MPKSVTMTLSGPVAVAKAIIRAQRLPLGLVVLSTLPGGPIDRETELSFGNIGSRDDYLRRLAINGGTYRILL